MKRLLFALVISAALLATAGAVKRHDDPFPPCYPCKPETGRY